jgi:hypothetical protein
MYTGTEIPGSSMTSPIDTSLLPIPAGIRSLACETVRRRVAEIPFARDGIAVTEDLVGAVLEILNGEFSGSISLKTVHRPAKKPYPGLDHCLARAGYDEDAAARVTADVLTPPACANGSRFRSGIFAARFRVSGFFGVAVDRAFRPCKENHRCPGRVEIRNPGFSRCPVCRTGILDWVTGRRLFGLPWGITRNAATAMRSLS